MTTSIPGLRGGGSSSTAANLRRLQRVIWLAYGIALAVAVGVSLGYALDERAARLDDARAHSLTLARALERQAGGLFGTAEQFLVAARDVIESNGGVSGISSARLDRLLATQRFQQGALRRALVIDETGQRRRTEGDPTDRDVSKRDWFRKVRAIRDRDVQIQAPLRSLVDGEWVLPITVRVERPDGSFGGAIVASVEVRYLVDFYESLGLEPRGSISLVRSDGTFVLRYPRIEQVAERPMAPRIFSRLQGLEGTFDSTQTFDGVGRIIAFRKMAQYPLYVTVAVASDTVVAPWQHHNVSRALATLGVILLLTILTALLSRRLEREAATVMSLTHFANAVDRSAGLVFWIRADGQFHYANESARRRLGYGHDRVSALSVRDVCPEYSAERWSDLWQSLRAKGDLRVTTEASTASGERFPLGIAATHVVIEGEAYAFAIGHDLTDQRRNEAAIRALNRNLEQKVLERTGELEHANASLASFSYSVAHDLRAPLRHLLAYSKALREELGAVLCDNARHLLLRIGERAQHMNALIEGLLRLSEIGRQALELREVDLSRKARDVVHELQRETPERRVTVSIDDGLRAIGDPALMRTLLQNLLGNAWKYSSKTPQAEVQFACDSSSGEAVFRVRDNGVGFDPDYSANLFGAFQRLHSQSDFPGTGIGLATAKRIVERHGGRIWAASTPGQGATFYFTLTQPD